MRALCGICNGSGRISDGRAERAEYIRIAIKVTSPQDHVSRCKITGQCGQCEKEARLLKQYGKLFHSIVNREGLPISGSFGWHRGFLRSISCSAEDWIANADALTSRHPIEVVNLATMPNVAFHVHEEGDGPRIPLWYFEDRPGISWETDFYYTEDIIREGLETIWPTTNFGLPPRSDNN
jgi:bacterioferritin-associated ferredoxin